MGGWEGREAEREGENEIKWGKVSILRNSTSSTSVCTHPDSISQSMVVGPNCDHHVVKRGDCLRLTCVSTPWAPVTWTRVDGREIRCVVTGSEDYARCHDQLVHSISSPFSQQTCSALLWSLEL